MTNTSEQQESGSKYVKSPSKKKENHVNKDTDPNKIAGWSYIKKF